jgi:murein DD-endopeptidase MepM/ murein hydrolase activator NlpD
MPGPIPTTPATGPWVSPMKNSAPGLLQQTGSTLMAAGDTEARLGDTIGDRVQETMDDAQTKSAETQFLKSSQDLLYSPQGGYLNTRGLDAQTQWDPATQAIAKARQDARSSLTNPIQQRMFDQVTNDHMMTLGRTMADHQHQQVTQYGIQQGQDRADSMNLLAKTAYLQGRMDDYQKYSGQAMDEVLHVAQLNGAAPDSDIAQAMLRARRTDLVHGITIGLLDDHKYDQAKQYFTDEQPNIDMRAGEVLDNAVKTEYDRNLTETKGDAFLAAAQNGGSVPHTYGPLATGSTINPMKITDVPGTPRPDGRVHDGYDIAMPAGTAVTSPLDGKVVKVWNDDKFGGGLSMRVQLADGNTLGVAHLSATNVNVGDTVNRGQAIALSGKTGNATGPVLHVALQDPDGKNIDYFGASKAQPDQAGVADPDVLQSAIDAAKNDSSLDPFQQKQVIRYMESQHMHERGIQEQQYLDVKQQAVDQLMQNGGNYNALPAAITSQLRPSDQFEFQARARGITEEQQKVTEVPVLANWAEHPEQMTPAAVNEAWVKGQLTQQSYLSSLRDAQKAENDPSYLRTLTVDHDQLSGILDTNQLSNLADPKTPADRASRVELESAIKNEIALQEQNVKRPLTWQEKGKVARDLVVDKVYTSTPFLGIGSGTLKPAAILNPDEVNKATVYVGSQKVRMMDIPAQYALDATQDLRTHGLPTTQANIAAWWVKKGSPKQ